MKLQKLNTGQHFITLPSQLVRAKGWVKGDDIVVEIDQKGNLVLRKK